MQKQEARRDRQRQTQTGKDRQAETKANMQQTDRGRGKERDDAYLSAHLDSPEKALSRCAPTILQHFVQVGVEICLDKAKQS